MRFGSFVRSFFVLNRPFLIYVQKRGAERPFFVMWVENVELLQHWQEPRGSTPG
jgi:hypothetical protein